jgi:hypothetical protein
MSDVVVQSIASNIFWIIVCGTLVVTFREEIRNLLNSLGSFKVAGASFELKNSRATLEYHVVLTNIIVEILSRRDSAQKLIDLVSDTNVKQLARFAIKYSKDVPEDAKEIELLKNIAIIIGRRGSGHEALAFINALLKDAPHDNDILNLKANLLFETHDSEKQIEAERIRDLLVVERPYDPGYRFNRALSKAYLKKDDEALSDIEKAMDLGFWKNRATMLDAREFKTLTANPEFARLETKLSDILSAERPT